MSVTTTRWWWIRHAPVINAEAAIYGQRDVPADTSDTLAYEALARELPVEDAVWIHSGLERTRVTAEATARAAGLSPDMLVEPAFMEQNFGDWQGMPRAQFYADRGIGVTRFWMSDVDECPPNGESFLDLLARTQPAITHHTRAHRGRDIIAFAHGGTIRAALLQALGLPATQVQAFQSDNLSLTRIEHLAMEGGREAWRVTAMNLPPQHGHSTGGQVLA